MSYLIDTNVLSELRRLRPDPHVAAWFREQVASTLFVAVLTLAEVRRGIIRLPAGAQRAALEEWLERDLVRGFRERILPVDLPVAMRWASLSLDASQQGQSVPTIDGLIAATALVHGLTVVTRNERDFERCGVRILNPWAEGAPRMAGG